LRSGGPGPSLPQPYEDVLLWGFDPAHRQLPPMLRYSLGLIVPALLIGFSVLRRRRWKEQPADPPVVLPAFASLAGVWLGAWILIGPPGEALRARDERALPYATEWSPAVAAADLVSDSLAAYEAAQSGRWLSSRGPGLGIGRGWNLLTASLAVRVT